MFICLNSEVEVKVGHLWPTVLHVPEPLQLLSLWPMSVDRGYWVIRDFCKYLCAFSVVFSYVTANMGSVLALANIAMPVTCLQVWHKSGCC